MTPQQLEEIKARCEATERLLAGIEFDTNGGCWLWSGFRYSQGYGGVYVGGRRRVAHRVSYTVFKGNIPDGLHVLHKCDVRACLNPDHLFLGTNADNVADKVAKGRALRGSQIPQSKLKEDDVRAIRAALAGGEVQSAIARRYGVDQTAISQINRRIAWRHVQ